MSRSRTERIEKTEREGKEEEREERKEKERKMDRGRSRDGEHRLLLGCVKKTPRTCISPHMFFRGLTQPGFLALPVGSKASRGQGP